MSGAAAEYICSAACQDVRERGRFTLVFSGGETPRPLYRLLASPPYTHRMPWGRTHVFWGDERCVSPESADSNFHHAHEILLSRVPIPSGHIHRIPAESGAESAAGEYKRELENFFLSSAGGTGYFPIFDCMLLGIGNDGHIASLFPEAPALEEFTRWVAPVSVPGGVSPVERVTLTLPVINRARRVLFLISGEGKRDIIGTVFRSMTPVRSLPVSLVCPLGECLFYLDFKV